MSSVSTTSTSHDGRCIFQDTNHHDHDENFLSEQGSNTCADNRFLSGETPIDDIRQKDKIRHEDALEKESHNEDDESEEYSDDDNRYEDDDSEEDRSLTACGGGWYSFKKGEKTHHEELHLSKQGTRLQRAFLKNIVVAWVFFFRGFRGFRGRSSMTRTPSIGSLSGGDGKQNIEFKSDHIIDPDSVYWINTDGYFRKGKAIGGCGAIVRDSSGNPIVACSGRSDSSSLLYQQLEGVKAGLQLAKKKGIRKIEMCCNSEQTREVILRFEDGKLDCLHPRSSYNFSESKDVICKACVDVFFLHIPLESASLFPLLSDVIELISDLDYNFHINAVERRLNRAADYLAKKTTTTDERIGLPLNYCGLSSQELRDILFEDACGRSLNGLPFPSQGFVLRNDDCGCTCTE